MRRGAVTVLVLATTLAVAACGSNAGTGSEATLDSWRASACVALTSYVEAMEPPKKGADDPALFSNDDERRQVKAMRGALTELEAIEVPDEQRADVERFVEIFAISVEAYERALPEIEAASRRLERAIKSIDPDRLPPPPEEPTTVAGGIMSQMMSIPEVADAYADMMRAYEAAVPEIDEAEADRLPKRLGLEKCLKPTAADEEEEPLSPAELASCGSRGEPVSVRELVEIFRANGITLDIDRKSCGIPLDKRVAGFDSDATNAGPDGLSQPDQRRLEEGHVLCDVENTGRTHGVEVTKYDTDTETRMRAANVSCTIYPHSTAREAGQVARLKQAMEAVAGLAR